jgi:hypothetical protein
MDALRALDAQDAGPGRVEIEHRVLTRYQRFRNRWVRSRKVP